IRDDLVTGVQTCALPISECVALENTLAQRFGLAFCRVAPDLGEGDLPLKALALEGASFLRQTLERGEDKVIGVGHGRTLAAVVRSEGRRVGNASTSERSG